MISPELRACLSRFRRQRRAYVCLLILIALFLVCLPAELLCNNRPIAVRAHGRWYFPVFRDYTERDFGGQRLVPPDYLDPGFRDLIGLGRPADTPSPADTGILDDFDPEPDGRNARPEQPSSILDDFDPEPALHPVADSAERSILDDFDPEPGDVTRTATPAGPPPPAAFSRAWVLWPPVRYDYAHIARDSTAGRDALASPWGQTIPTTGQRFASSWRDGHYLGTDDRGRDVLARLVYGFRVSLAFGFLVACTGVVLGVIFGAVQGFFGGWVDLLGQRFTEIWESMPQLYLLMIISSMLARNIYVLFIILNLTSWMGMAAYMRAEFLRGRNLDYVKAARALGVSNRAIMFRHLLPNSLTPIITFFPFNVTGGVLALVSLDFLGLGVPSPYPSLGELLAQGHANLHATWIIVPTFLILSSTVTLLTFVGDGLRNAFDPRRSTAAA